MMLALPCPHCRKSYQFDPGPQALGEQKLQCPSCRGLFILRTATTTEEKEPKAAQPKGLELEGLNGTGPLSSNTNPSQTISEKGGGGLGGTTLQTAGLAQPIALAQGKADKKRWPKILTFMLLVLFLVGSIFLTFQIVKEYRGIITILSQEKPAPIPEESTREKTIDPSLTPNHPHERIP